jgi:hypothetical protein
MYGVCLGGIANAPAVMAYKAAPDLAVGMNACEAMMTDLTFVYYIISSGSFDINFAAAYLVIIPPVTKGRLNDGCWARNAPGIQDQDIPGTNFPGNLFDSVFVGHRACKY